MTGNRGRADAGEEMKKSGGDHNLAWWPCELSAAQQMDVEVRDGFAAVRAVIDDCAVTCLIDSDLPRYFSGSE